VIETRQKEPHRSDFASFSAAGSPGRNRSAATWLRSAHLGTRQEWFWDPGSILAGTVNADRTKETRLFAIK
jgi:hypothetical protein